MTHRPPAARRGRRLLRGVRVTTGMALLCLAVLSAAPSGAQDGPPTEATTTTTTTTPTPVQRAPEDACNGVSNTISLIGSSSAKEALTGWALEICDRSEVVADYTDFGSFGGREAVIPADAAVIGLTSLPFTAEEQEALKEGKRGIVLVPIIGTSVACTYWDTNPAAPSTAGTRFPDLRISRRTLADLTGGSPRDGTNFSPELAEDNVDNPAYQVRPPVLNVEVWVRSGYSAVMHRLTEWFAQDEDASKDFLKGAFEGYELPFEDIGTPDGGSPALVNDYTTMKSRMLGALQNLGIGCMDGATARTDARPETEPVEALNVAWLDNAAGEFVAPTTASVTKAISAMVPAADGTFTPKWDLEDPEAYPLPLLVYAALPTCGITADQRAAMDAVITYAVGPGQQVLPEGNVALPKNVSDVASRQLASWRSLVKAAPCDPVPTTTTTTTPGAPTITAPGPTPTDPAFVPPVDGFGGGVFTDPGFTGGGGDGGGTVEDAAPTTGGEEAAGGGGAGGGADGGTGPVAAARRIMAIAQGSAAVPPVALALGGAGLLLAGPVVLAASGARRAGSLPASAIGWFGRLRP